MSTYKGDGGSNGSSPCCMEKDLHPEILRNIFTFVGGYEYRFVAAVSKTFRSLYSEQFPDKLTSDACAGLSMDHAKVYLDERRFILSSSDSDANLRKMQNILNQAVMNNNLDVIEWILKPSNDTVDHIIEKACRVAVENGKVDCLRYFLAKNKSIVVPRFFPSYFLLIAAENGQLEALKFLCSEIPLSTKAWGNLSINAAAKGHVDCLQYVYEEGECSRLSHFHCYTTAARYGHLDCIIYLYENIFFTLDDVEKRRVMEAAARGSYRCFQYLHGRNFSWNEIDCFRAALIGGNFECADFISKACPNVLRTNTMNSIVFEAAARSGNLECLQFLFEKRCPWNSRVSSAAASVESIDCLRYLHENGCPIDQRCTSAAARAGSVECLQYLHENGCEWNGVWCCKSAVSKGNLHCLRYLRENGCALRPELYDSCMGRIRGDKYCEKNLRDCIDFLQYLKDAGVDTPFETVSSAIKNNWTTLFQYFNLDTLINGNQGNEAFLEAIRQKSHNIYPNIHHLYKDEWKNDTIYCFEALKSGRMKLLQHLLEDGFKASKRETIYTSEAARHGNLHFLKYLLDKGFKAAKDICVDAAASGNVECLKFLHSSGFDMTQDVFNASTNAQCIKYCTKHGFRRRSSRKRSAAEAL